MKKLLCFISIVTITSSLFSVNIRFLKAIEDFGFQSYEEELRTLSKNRLTVNISGVYWINEDKILLHGVPFYFIADINSGIVSRAYEIEKIMGIRNPSSANLVGKNYIVFRRGRIFDLKYFIFDYNHGFKELSGLDEYKGLAKYMPRKGKDSLYDWERFLLGKHRIVPAPKYELGEHIIYDTYEYGVSFLKNGVEEIIIAPEGFFAVRNLGSMAYTSVSFDKFQIAIYSDAIIKDEKDFGDWRKVESALLIFEVEYDGKLTKDVYLKKEPSYTSSDISMLKSGTEVLVTDADNYVRDHKGMEDYWYYVSYNGTTGWVFGGDLLIEGEKWEDRLVSRGLPLEWESLGIKSNN